MYYNYHAQIKRKICNGELLSYHFDYHYKNIGFVLVLCFKNKTYPIRESHFEEYFDLIGNNYFISTSINKHFTKFKK